MDKSAGENVDLLLENLPVGRGEIIVIEDLMGLRITDLTQAETAGEKEVAEDD
jgi:flagellar motor switch/type III secretory pathway protein FliN